jgi:hypothetical protein
VLFLPEGNEGFRQKSPQSVQAVDAGVATGAEGNQQVQFADSGCPVMDAERLPCPAAAAPEIVAEKDGIAVAGKVKAGAGLCPVAAGAEAGDGGNSGAAGAEKRFLADRPFSQGGAREGAGRRRSEG